MNTIRENSFVFIAILSVAAFILGWLIAPGDKVDVSQYEREREGYERQIRDLNRQIASQDSISREIRNKMSVDSLAYLDALKRKEITIAALRGKIDEVSFKNHTSADLDRIRAEILSAR